MVNKTIVKVEQNFSGWLDNLRGVSSWIVFLCHIDQIFIIPVIGMGGLYPVLTLLMASYSVMIFFVLSGFVITLSIIRNINKNGFFRAPDFFLSRIARLYPPLLFGLFISLLTYYIVTFFNLHGSISYLLPGDHIQARPKVSVHGFAYFVNFFMLQGFVKEWGAVRLNGPLWSLGYEYWLYIIAMFFTVWIKGRQVLLGGVIFFLLLVYLFYSGNIKFIFLATVWMTGSLLALFYHYLRPWMTRVVFIAPIVFTSLITGYLCLKTQNNAYLPYRSNVAYLFQAVTMVGASTLFFALAIHFKWGMSWFSSRFFRPAADYSYTLYVVHFPLLLFSYSLLHVKFHSSGTIARILIISFIIVAVPWFCKKMAIPLEDTGYFKSLLLKLIPKKRQEINNA